jgi:hypothetical protein
VNPKSSSSRPVPAAPQDHGRYLGAVAGQPHQHRGARTHNLKNIDLDIRATSWW